MALTFAGKVDFTVRGKLAPHRFEVSVTDENKSVIWLEDCQSKKQWQTNALETKDFIADKNIIPQASNVDYAERFATCLRSMDAVKFKRTLSSKGNERILVLAFQLPWISPELVVEYEFVLFEVPLERIDILGARVRDVEEKVADVAESRLAVLTDEHGALKADSQRLEQRVGELEKKVFSTPLYARATTQRNHNTNETLVWVLQTGGVRFRCAGLYVLDIDVAHSGARGRDVFELVKAGVVLASAQGSSGSGIASTSLHYALNVKANDEISVIYQATGQTCAASYMTILKL